MDQHQVAYALEEFAEKAGFVPACPFYIHGQFHVKPAQGIEFYSDESFLFCKECADDLFQKAFPFLSDDEREDTEVWCSDPSCPVDTPAACKTCGKTLRHCLTERCGVGQELWHYRENPIVTDEIILPDTAYCIAQIVSSAYHGEDVAEAIALGESALAVIASLQKKENTRG
jgi:hypothetical protein